jgi:hypothetical protein
MENDTNLCNETISLYVERNRRREKHEKRNPKQATDCRGSHDPYSDNINHDFIKNESDDQSQKK